MSASADRTWHCHVIAVDDRSSELSGPLGYSGEQMKILLVSTTMTIHLKTDDLVVMQDRRFVYFFVPGEHNKKE